MLKIINIQVCMFQLASLPVPPPAVADPSPAFLQKKIPTYYQDENTEVRVQVVDGLPREGENEVL